MRVAYLLTGDGHTAQDLVQSVLAKALLRWNRILESDDVDSYLRRAIVNERTSRWRGYGRREVATGVPPELADEGAFARLDDRAALLGVLKGLPRKQRAAVVLRYFEDLPDEQIAVILGCSVGTVRSQVARGLDKVRAAVAIGATQPHEDHALNGGAP